MTILGTGNHDLCWGGWVGWVREVKFYLAVFLPLLNKTMQCHSWWCFWNENFWPVPHWQTLFLCSLFFLWLFFFFVTCNNQYAASYYYYNEWARCSNNCLKWCWNVLYWDLNLSLYPALLCHKTCITIACIWYGLYVTQ